MWVALYHARDSLPRRWPGDTIVRPSKAWNSRRRCVEEQLATGKMREALTCQECAHDRGDIVRQLDVDGMCAADDRAHLRPRRAPDAVLAPALRRDRVSLAPHDEDGTRDARDLLLDGIVHDVAEHAR